MCKKKLRVRDELMWIFSWTDFPLRIRDTRRADTRAGNEPMRSFTFKTIKTLDMKDHKGRMGVWLAYCSSLAL